MYTCTCVGYYSYYTSLIVAKVEAPPPKQPTTTPTASSADISTIQDRLRMYQESVKMAETQGDSSKVRRYKRSLGTLEDMLKTAKGGRPVNMDELPPAINTPKPAAEPSSIKPRPQPSANHPGNLIDLDAPEFDEFTLSEEDMASLMTGFVDDRSEGEPHPSLPSSSVTATPPTNQPSTKPTPKPRAPPTSSSRPPGLIDLDTPEFAEFDLSDADLEMLSGAFVDDRDKGGTPMGKPEVPPPSTQSLPSKPAIVPQPTTKELTKELVLQALNERKDQYMTASQNAKSKGDEKTRKQYGMVAVNFKRAIESVSSGAPVDLRGIPPPPPGFSSKCNIDISSYGAKPHPPVDTASPQSSVASQQPDDDEEGAVDSSIPTPKTPLEALIQRLEKYKEGLKNAQEKGETSRVRRTGRIIKQYEDAIKLTKAGKPCDYNDLPTPPGFPPIPSGGGRAKPSVTPGTSVGPRPQPLPTQSLPAKVPIKLTPSVSDRQLQAIQERGSHYMTAVKQAKAKGDRDKALMYLKYYKSIQQMLQAAQGGLPVDLSQVSGCGFNIMIYIISFIVATVAIL